MGAIIASVILSARAIGPISKFGLTLSKASAALSARNNLSNFLSQEKRANEASDMSGLNKTDYEVKVSNATLRLGAYGSPLFNGLNLNLRKGEKVAVVGKSGAGKTSLLQILNGINDLETGNVLIKGRDIRDFKKDELHKSVGTVFQEAWLFQGTLKENISLDSNHIQEKEIINIFRELLGEENFFRENEALDFSIKDRGSNLSGGQKQIISLVRCLAPNPSILLLDEPTSALDIHAESMVIRGLKRIWAEKTVVVVTHKLSLMSICDRVVVLDTGRIIWDGSKKDYIEIAQRQMASQKGSMKN